MESIKEKTKVGKFLQNAAALGQKVGPDVLNLLGNVTGVDALKNLANVIKKDEDLPDEAKENALALLELDLNAQIELEREMTKRITGHQELEKVQVQQDDLYTKRARPTRQYFWLLFLLLCYPVAWALNDHKFIELPEIILVGIFSDFGVYSVLRSNEKLDGKMKFKNPFKRN